MQLALTKEIRRRLLEEENKPECWWYLSFAGDNEFLGGVIIKAKGLAHALIYAGIRGIAPGYEAYGFDVPDDKLPEEHYRNRLLTLAELQEFWDMETLKENNDNLRD